MKILAGAYLAETPDGVVCRTRTRQAAFGPFADLNAARLAFADLPDMPEWDAGDFGRGGAAVRKMMLAGVLATWDLGAPLPETTGVFGWNGAGCTAENLRYWQDYTANGREAGRGGLFVATLPTIPYCEAAIALRCRGPVAYFRTAPGAKRLFELVETYPAGPYLCGELTAGGACVILADTSLAGDAPECEVLSDLFAEAK